MQSYIKNGTFVNNQNNNGNYIEIYPSARE